MATMQGLYDDAGNSHNFFVHEIGTTYKTLAGIYAFAKDNGDTWTVIYVGETDNFKRRLTDELESHHRVDCARKNGATHLLTLPESDSDRRLSIEAGIRRKYDPACNRQ